MDCWKKRYEPAPFPGSIGLTCREASGGSLLVDICKQDRRGWVHDPRGNRYRKSYFSLDYLKSWLLKLTRRGWLDAAIA